MEKREAEVEFDLVELLYRVFASWMLILALCIAGVLIAGPFTIPRLLNCSFLL